MGSTTKFNDAMTRQYAEMSAPDGGENTQSRTSTSDNFTLLQTPIPIFVKTPTGKFRALETDPSDQFEEAQASIEDKDFIMPETQSFISATKHSDYSRINSHCRTQNDFTIRSVLKLRSDTRIS